MMMRKRMRAIRQAARAHYSLAVALRGAPVEKQIPLRNCECQSLAYRSEPGGTAEEIILPRAVAALPARREGCGGLRVCGRRLVRMRYSGQRLGGLHRSFWCYTRRLVHQGGRSNCVPRTWFTHNGTGKRAKLAGHEGYCDRRRRAGRCAVRRAAGKPRI